MIFLLLNSKPKILEYYLAVELNRVKTNSLEFKLAS